MTEEQVTVVIVGKDTLSKVFQSVGKTAEREGKKVEKSFGEKLQAVGKSATDVGKKLSIGVTAPLAAFGGLAVNSAVKAERLSKTLNGLAGSSEEAAKYIDAIKDASLDTVPKIEALEIANRALSFGVVQNTDEMKKLTQVAIALGRAQGLDASTAVSDLTTALSRQSPMILDNLGITLKLTEAYRIYGEKIGKSADALNEEEKALAFREAALIKGMEVVEKMGGIQDDAAASAERAAAQMKDMALTVGQSLIPVMQMGLDVVRPLIQAFTDADPAIQKLIVGVAALAAGIGPALGTFGKLASVIGSISAAGGPVAAFTQALQGTQGQLIAVTAAVGALIGVYMAYQSVQDAVAEGERKLADAIESQRNQIDEAILANEITETTLVDLAKAGNDAEAALNKDGNALVDFAAASVRANVGLSALYQTAGQAQKVIAEQATSLEDYNKRVKDWNKMVGHSDLKLREKVASQWKDVEAQKAAIAIERERYELEKQGIEVITDQEEAWRMLGEALSIAAEITPRDVHAESRAMTDYSEKLRITSQAVEEKAAADAAAAAAGAAHTAAARDAAAALRDQRQAAADTAEATASLAGSLKDASSSQIASAMINQLDAQTLGADAYTKAVTDIQLAFGLADERSIALAQNMGELAKSINEGDIAGQDASEALQALVDDAEDGDVTMGNLTEQFASGKKQLEELYNALTDTSEQLDSLTREPFVIKIETDTSGVITGAEAVAAPGSVPVAMQSGGWVPGPPGHAQPIIAHGGEYVVPADVARGAVTNNYSYGGDTHNVTINDRMAMALYLAEQRDRRFSQLNARW